MKRLPGITVSAIVVLLLSLLQLLLALGMGVAGVISSNRRLDHTPSGAYAAAPAWMPLFMLGVCAFFVALAAWGILTAVGLFRVRRWARYSMLVIGSGLAVMGLFSMLAMLALLIVQLPIPAGTDPAHAHTAQAVAKSAFAVIALFYGVLCAVGVWWLVYFNRKSVSEIFQSASGQFEESRRPFLIAILAVLFLIGACSCLLMAMLPFPGAFMGTILHGWAKAVFYLVYAALMGVAGVGLWRLQEWGRRLAFLIQAFGLVHLLVYLARPSLMTRYHEEISQQMHLAQPRTMLPNLTVQYSLQFGLGLLMVVAVMAVLHGYRRAFVAPVKPPQEAPAETP